MLTETQRKQVRDCVDIFKELAHEYLEEKDHLEKNLDNLQVKEKELEGIAKEERQIAAAIEVLYGQSNDASKISERQREISELNNKCECIRRRVNEITGKLSELLRSLPIPADLDHPDQKGSEVIFPYFEDSFLGTEAINAVSSLLRKKSPPSFGDVTIYEEKVSVKDVSDRLSAIQKLVKAIGEFRVEADNLSKSYEKIDDLVDRLRRSNLYVDLLMAIEKSRGISSSQIAQNLGIDERKVYDNCYNLTRSNWNPPPIMRNSSGGWELTVAGEILLNRFLEKCPEEKKNSHEGDTRQSGGVPNRNPDF
jgi:uncharacterized coiled-coil DUF342 family protein